MQVVMEPVDKLPPSKGTRAYIEQADSIRSELRSQPGKPILVARDDKRSALDRIARHLRTEGDVNAVVKTTDKDDEGRPTEYTLYAEFTGI